MSKDILSAYIKTEEQLTKDLRVIEHLLYNFSLELGFRMKRHQCDYVSSPELTNVFDTVNHITRIIQQLIYQENKE